MPPALLILWVWATLCCTSPAARLRLELFDLYRHITQKGLGRWHLPVKLVTKQEVEFGDGVGFLINGYVNGKPQPILTVLMRKRRAVTQSRLPGSSGIRGTAERGFAQYVARFPLGDRN